MSQDIEYDEINSPKHYNSHESGIEAIEITRWLIGGLSNMWKYAMRYEDKGTPKKDLGKLCYYGRDFIKNYKPTLDSSVPKLAVPHRVLNLMSLVIREEPVEEIKTIMTDIRKISMGEYEHFDKMGENLDKIEEYSLTFSK